MKSEESFDPECEAKLRPVNEDDLRETLGMTRYRDIDVFGENGEIEGVNHMFCNDIELEGETGFKTKSIYVFHNGAIMTVDEGEQP